MAHYHLSLPPYLVCYATDSSVSIPNKIEGEVGIGESYKWGHDLINESYYLTGNV